MSEKISSNFSTASPAPAALEKAVQEAGSLPALNDQLLMLNAPSRIQWAIDTFQERLVLSSSFGAQSAVMLHMVTALKPDIPVVLVDTGYLFSETYHFIDALKERLQLKLVVARPELSPAWLEARHGKLWEQGLEGLEKYNDIMKVQPMEKALSSLQAAAWLAGLRTAQSSSRKNLSVVALQSGRAKIHPILDWTDKDIFHYFKKHNLPYHPLWEKGYLSIGDWHTSRPVDGDLTEEESRFYGLKRECGLHEGSSTDYEI